ncbi:hypothetical protein BGZ49_008160 [Haplosporangium sp. Z 27]|nr:hypothetical protein BGZ49_008160 [Haplosporangium sp. Z 27]
MASPPIQFDADPSLMAGGAAPGSTYGGYQNIYGANMNFTHPASYAIPSPATPPALPPMHNNGAYAPNGTNFQFPYNDPSSAPTSTSGAVAAAAPVVVSAPLTSPTGTQPTDAQQSPHAQQLQTPPQQHPQTPQQQQQQQQQQQNLQRIHQPINTTQSYQTSPQAHHPGMTNLMHGHTLYPGDNRYDRMQPQQQQQRYMDPNMQSMMGRNGPRPGDMAWPQNGMMPDLLGANHGGAIRNVAGQQARAQVKQGLGGLNGMGGMAMNGMNGLGGMGGLAGMPTMGWGGMVGAPTSPYGHPHAQQALQHPQQFHPHGLTQNPYQQQSHMMHHQQGIPQHMGIHGRPGALGPVVGGGISKKKIKKPIVPVVKDKNCPKRPRNSDDIKKKHPEFKPTEITKMLGEEWQKLSEAEKESYGSMAENDKKRYQNEMETYDANGGATGAAAAAAAAAAASEGNIPPGIVPELGGEAWRA